MEILLRHRSLVAAANAPALFNEKVIQRWAPQEPFCAVWWVLAAVVSISFLPEAAGEGSLFLTIAIAVLGAAGCAWMWLLARTLFRPEPKIDRKNLFVVAAVIAFEGTARLEPVLASAGVNGELLRLFSNAESVVCISVIAFVFVEALHGYGSGMTVSEKRFRLSFMVGFGSIIAIAIIWGAGLDETSYGADWSNGVSFASGMVAILGSRLAVEFRKRHPLAPIRAASRARPKKIKASDHALSRRILETVEDERFLTNADVKLADIAAHLGVHDYLVTQCITGDLAFRNFNHLMNTHRLRHVKEQLSDPNNHQKRISSIAFDCGFNSIGTFNRAFKNEVGITPREFQASTNKSD